MSIPRKVKNQQTIERVYSAITDMLKDYGYEYLTMRNICEKADVAYSSIYHFFGSKEELMFQYCKLHLQAIVNLNPYPDSIAEDDFISRTLWPFYVYLLALEDLGWELTLNLFHNVNEDLFWDLCNDRFVVPSLHSAISKGYIVNDNKSEIQDDKLIGFLTTDMRIMLTGAILNWCRVCESGGKTSNLHILFSRILNRYLLSWASDEYRALYTSGQFSSHGLLRPGARNLVKLVAFPGSAESAE